jgi:hypothetical protein
LFFLIAIGAIAFGLLAGLVFGVITIITGAIAIVCLVVDVLDLIGIIIIGGTGGVTAWFGAGLIAIAVAIIMLGGGALVLFPLVISGVIAIIALILTIICAAILALGIIGIVPAGFLDIIIWSPVWVTLLISGVVAAIGAMIAVGTILGLGGIMAAIMFVVLGGLALVLVVSSAVLSLGTMAFAIGLPILIAIGGVVVGGLGLAIAPIIIPIILLLLVGYGYATGGTSGIVDVFSETFSHLVAWGEE